MMKTTRSDFRSRRPGAGAICVMAIIVTWSASTSDVYAQEWRFDPIVRAGYEVDDNAVLSIRTDEEVAIAGYQGDLLANIDYSSAVTTFSLTPRVRIRRYDESEFDSTDYFLRAVYRYRTRASNFGIRAFLERESVRTAERAGADLEVDDVGDITNDDSGLVQLGGARDKVRLRPFWSYRVSDTSAIGAEIDYFDVAYDDVFADILTDYTDTIGRLTFSRALSSRTEGIIVGTARRYENDDEVLEFDGYGFLVGFDHALSETISLNVLVGLDSVTFDAANAGDDEAIVGEVTLVRELETIRVLAQYKRAITASGTRVPTVRDNYNLNFTRRLSEKISAGIGARAYQTELISGDSDFGRDYIKIRAGLRWHFTAVFQFEFEVSHTIIDRGGPLSESADSNQAAIWFVYRPNMPTQL